MIILDAFCGEGGAGMGYHRAGWEVFGVDKVASRLRRYPFPSQQGDAIQFILERGREFDAIHASPTCTGYSRGTVAIQGREHRYDRLIAATRAALRSVGKPYIIENVEGAAPELRDPILLCGRQFGLTATDTDGTELVLDRHRLLESSEFLLAPAHEPHSARLRVAGSYGGARRDKDEAKHIRRGGYVPSADVQRQLIGVPWMTETGCKLSIPPVYTEYIGVQLAERLERAA